MADSDKSTTDPHVRTTVDMATAITVVDACTRANVPALLMGDPGVGKSSVIRALAQSQDLMCEVLLGSIREPADIGGMPLVRENDYTLVPGRWARRLCEAGEGYLFLDELTTCSPTVQGAMLAVVLDKVVGDLTLPPGVRVVAGANPPGSAAGGYPLEAPLANRFCHIPFGPTVEQWLDGMSAGWKNAPASRAVVADEVSRAAARTAVIGFVRAQPGVLHGLSQTQQPSGPWGSPRTWEMLSRVLAFVRGDDLAARSALACGLVGEGVGTEFITWTTEADLPDPASVVADPSIVDWNGRPDRVWAVLTGVAAWAADRGTKEAWREAWGPLAVASEAGVADVAGAAARALARSRPVGMPVPRAARAFKEMLEIAGLLEAA